MSFSSKDSSNGSSSWAYPLTTWCAPFIAATLMPVPFNSSLYLAIVCSISSSDRNTAAINPGPGSSLISLPRPDAKRQPSSSENIPAVRAAAISPRLCPKTREGTMPILAQRSVNAHSGCTHLGSSKSVAEPPVPNMRSINDVFRSSRITCSQRSTVSRKIGSLSYSDIPMPDH